MPKDQISTFLVMGDVNLLFESLSGAMYSSVPDNEESMTSSLVTS